MVRGEELRKSYYSQGPRLERIGWNRYKLTFFKWPEEETEEYILTRYMAKRVWPKGKFPW